MFEYVIFIVPKIHNFQLRNISVHFYSMNPSTFLWGSLDIKIFHQNINYSEGRQGYHIMDDISQIKQIFNDPIFPHLHFSIFLNLYCDDSCALDHKLCLFSDGWTFPYFK